MTLRLEILEEIRERELAINCVSTHKTLGRAFPTLPAKEIRSIVRDLRKDGSIKIVPAFNFDTGLLVGSGYVITGSGVMELTAAEPPYRSRLKYWKPSDGLFPPEGSDHVMSFNGPEFVDELNRRMKDGMK